MHVLIPTCILKKFSVMLVQMKVPTLWEDTCVDIQSLEPLCSFVVLCWSHIGRGESHYA